MEEYKTTIGIECHVQLNTKTKLFSAVDNDAVDKEPNSCVSPIIYWREDRMGQQRSRPRNCATKTLATRKLGY